MPEMSRKFTLEIVQPVLNVGDEQADALKEAVHPDGRRSIVNDQLVKILRPARSAAVKFIDGREVMHVRERADIPVVSEDHNEELALYLEDRLSDTSGVPDVATWPYAIEPLNEGRVLMVGNSPYFAEKRDAMKRALAEYYGVDFDSDVWFKDELANGLWLVHSQKKGSHGLVDRLGRTLTRKKELMPERLMLGEIAVERLKPKKKQNPTQ